jgi:hypothetical protein
MVKCQFLSFRVMWFVLMTAALGFYTMHYLALLPSWASAVVTAAGDPAVLPDCENGIPGQYSVIHRGWVCSAELASESMD